MFNLNDNNIISDQSEVENELLELHQNIVIDKLFENIKSN